VPAGSPVRLDQFLIAQRAERSRRQARELIALGAVRVDGRPARKGQMVRSGQVVSISSTPGPVVELAAEPALDVEVLFADDALIAVNKPAGMPSTARRNDDRGCVANFLLGRFPELRTLGTNPLEAGLVHRLDTDTSGLLLAARTAQAHAALRRQFRNEAVDKYYLALVAGEVQRSRIITHPIAHMPRRPRRMRACTTPSTAAALGGRRAETTFWPFRRASGATLVAARMRTGVRHQVRVHLASAGHPVIGDPLYARRYTGLEAPRLLLHAWQLRLTHPTQGRPLDLRVGIPADFRGVLTALPWLEGEPSQWSQILVQVPFSALP
jgi:23S rRNA pseudouridine1911/1915/1917 synthase